MPAVAPELVLFLTIAGGGVEVSAAGVAGALSRLFLHPAFFALHKGGGLHVFIGVV